MEKNKVFSQSPLDRITILLGCIFCFALFFYLGKGGDSFFFYLMKFFAFLSLIIGGIVFFKPMKIIINDSGIATKALFGKKNECNWEEIKDFNFVRVSNGSYTFMELKKYSGDAFTIMVVNEKIIMEIVNHLDKWDIDDVMIEYKNARFLQSPLVMKNRR